MKLIIILLIVTLNIFGKNIINLDNTKEIKSSDLNNNFSNVNKPDFESGWIAVSTDNHNTEIINHNLGVVPNRVTIQFTDSLINNEPNVVVIANLSHGEQYAPRQVSLSKNKIAIQFYANTNLITCSLVTNIDLGCLNGDGTIYKPPGTYTGHSYRSGFMKVILYKD